MQVALAIPVLEISAASMVAAKKAESAGPADVAALEGAMAAALNRRLQGRMDMNGVSLAPFMSRFIRPAIAVAVSGEQLSSDELDRNCVSTAAAQLHCKLRSPCSCNMISQAITDAACNCFAYTHSAALTSQHTKTAHLKRVSVPPAAGQHAQQHAHACPSTHVTAVVL